MLSSYFKRNNSPEINISLKSNHGFTLIEILVGVAVFSAIVISVYGAFALIEKTVIISKTRIAMTDIGREQLEIIRNLSYSNVGIIGGLPAGKIIRDKTVTRSGINFDVLTTVRGVTDPSSTHLYSDYKLVELDISCENGCSVPTESFSTIVSANGLIVSTTTGAIVVRALDSGGNPVEGANITVNNNSSTSPILVNDTTDKYGNLEIIDVPPGVNNYSVSIQKDSYSSDRTYPPGGSGNPNPINPDATVVAGNTTQLSFLIDKVSSINFSTLTDTCSPVPDIGFSLSGTKLIGTSPDVLKYSQNFSSGGSGIKNVNNLEWDVYNTSVSDPNYVLAGTIPLLPLNLLPDTSQNFDFILEPKNPKQLLITVDDSQNGLPITGADVEITDSHGTSTTLTTGRGFLGQNDWTGGDGQEQFIDPTKYSTSTNIDNSDSLIGIKLSTTTVSTSTTGYYATGTLISSTYDTGAPSNFYEITWLPQSEPPETGSSSVEFQIASNNDDSTWNFSGPDGTESTFYTLSDGNINSINNGNRYFRYKVFLSTDDDQFSPVLSSLSLTFSSSCVPPGQVLFSNLNSGSYDLSVSKSGYQDYSGTVSVSSDWQQSQIPLSSE